MPTTYPAAPAQHVFPRKPELTKDKGGDWLLELRVTKGQVDYTATFLVKSWPISTPIDGHVTEFMVTRHEEGKDDELFELITEAEYHERLAEAEKQYESKAEAWDAVGEEMKASNTFLHKQFAAITGWSFKAEREYLTQVWQALQTILVPSVY